MLFPRFRVPKYFHYKNKLFNKWVTQCKNLYTDYANVGISTYRECINNPFKSTLILAATCGIYYMKSHNPSELNYRSAVVDTNNRSILVPNLIRNPRATDHLKMIDKSFSQGLIRHFNCGLFSIIWLDDYENLVSLYKRNCSYLTISWAEIPHKIIDIGFLNRWWILNYKMIDYDVNLHEFEKKAHLNVANFQSLNPAMALYKTSLDMIVKNSRLFSFVVRKTGESWFGRMKESPAWTALQNTTQINNEHWTKFRKEILNSESGVKTFALDTTIILLCASSRNLDLAKSYLKYLRENEYDLNTAVVGKYFELLFNCKEAVTDIDKKEILSMYDNLRLKHPLLDAATAESCALVISLTQRWKECAELLEMIKISCTPSSVSYSALITASFNNGEPEMGWKYLTEMVKLKRTPHSNTYISCVNYYSKNSKEPDICVQEIGKLFHFFADHDLMPNKDVMEHIKNTFQTLGWDGAFTTLNKVGMCRNCNHQLEPLKLSEEDFSHLSKTILDKALVGNDIYFKSTPHELNRFKKFVNTTKPFDVVIDGLNVGYKSRKQWQSNAAKQLAMVVRHFLDKNKVVLVLGRQHMRKWDQHCMNYIKKNSFLFLTDNLSSDDPCLLYATLASGPETEFVSSDLMRQHKFILQDVSSQRMFKRWQMSHQIFPIFMRDKLSLIPPLNYLPVAQGDENCWHIPYKLSTQPVSESYEPPSDWLCLKRVSPSCK